MTKKIWTLRIAAVLLCLTCLTTSLVAGLYARYTTTSGSSDAARVAKFDVTSGYSGAQTFAIDDLVPGAANAKTVTVRLTNASEVAVSCEVKRA